MSQLEPSSCESIRKFIRVFEEAPGDLFIDGIDPQRNICRQHGWKLLFGSVKSIGNNFSSIDRYPLMGAGGAFGQFPFKVEKVFKEVVAPLRWRLRPGYFQSTGDGVCSLSRSIAVGPA